MFVDYYEVLQISPNADQETVRRVYRIQAQRFHPDNLETGDAEKFRLLADAYEILGDPRSRSSYDEEYRKHLRAAQAASLTGPPTDPRDEPQRRAQILQLLYRRRQSHPDQPSLGLRDLQTLLGMPREHLEFSLWYLKETGYLTRSDSARHIITIKGVEFAESMGQRADDLSHLDAGADVG